MAIDYSISIFYIYRFSKKLLQNNAHLFKDLSNLFQFISIVYDTTYT